MSDRIKGFWVALTQDYKDEDADRIREAISMIKSVAAVESSVSDSDDWMNRTQIRNELTKKLFDVVYEK